MDLLNSSCQKKRPGSFKKEKRVGATHSKWEFDGIVLDYSRQRATACTFQKLFALAREARVPEKIEAMFCGVHINQTEDRPVLHVALRAPRSVKIMCDGKDVVPEVWEVLDHIRRFSDQVRLGSWVGETGKVLKDVVAIGIGGSYLGPLFAYTALQTDPESAKLADGRRLRFLANVDPVDVAIAINGLNPETTLGMHPLDNLVDSPSPLNASLLGMPFACRRSSMMFH